MSSVVFFAVFVLSASMVHVAGQPGFLSIDCGLEADLSGRKDSYTGIVYVSDGAYVDGGERHRVAAEFDTSAALSERLRTLRSFPSGERNCTDLPTEIGVKYLLRMEFFYGNYDGKNRLSTQFELHLGTNYWDTYETGTRAWPAEITFVAWASWAPACLVNTGGGTPFVNSVELRRLGTSLYPNVTIDQSMNLYSRIDIGSETFIRYPDDPYDRFWWGSTGSAWANLSTTSTVRTDVNFATPMAALQTAVVPVAINGTNTTTFHMEFLNVPSYFIMAFLYFADFQNSKPRQFDVYFNGNREQLPHSPSYLAASCVYSSGWYKVTDSTFNVTLAPTNTSMLSPMLNAYELHNLIAHDVPTTFHQDFDAIMAIKLEYGVKKNWMGDPCLPTKYAWEGVQCRNTTGNTTRIISLDLSNSSLHGVISNKFALFTALEYLNLSGNRLNGSLPDSLCKSNSESHVFRYESDQYICSQTNSPSPSRKRTSIISISVSVPVLVATVLVISYLVWRQKRKPNLTLHPARVAKLVSAPGSGEGQQEHLQNTENRRFTYKELEKFTNKFEWLIGQGGFGPVYYGRLEENTEVAVKIRSESSSHGLDEFLAEVQSLTKVHHRNLVSLVGYCLEKDCLALVYEYMSQGNLCDHLRGKGVASETLSWGTRVRVVLEAAEGLDYLHKGCSVPIVHRDVKASNILLGQNHQAKIADFGLCKTYLSDTQTHVSTVAAGTVGYIDPEYYHTGRLSESSDVYSFGVVLLEIATGERPVLPSLGHIVQRTKQKIASGNISSVADARLHDAYDVSSMWKVVDTALACTADAAARRPTMATVVVQLRESLALEEARECSGVERSAADRVVMVSAPGPSAR